MRVLVGLFCLLIGVPEQGEADEIRKARYAEYRAVVAEAATSHPQPGSAVSDLPDDVRAALDGWIERHST